MRKENPQESWDAVPESEMYHWDGVEESERAKKKFTDRVRRIMQLATREAYRLGHEYVYPEHLLLGIIKEGRGVAIRMLLEKRRCGRREFRQEIEERLQAGPTLFPEQDLPLPHTGSFMVIVVQAWAEARKLRQKQIGSEHILLGLLRHHANGAVRLLNDLGIDVDELYCSLRGELAGESREDGEQQADSGDWASNQT